MLRFNDLDEFHRYIQLSTHGGVCKTTVYLPGTGLKKCSPANLAWRLSEQASAISVTERDEVLVAKMHSALLRQSGSNLDSHI